MAIGAIKRSGQGLIVAFAKFKWTDSEPTDRSMGHCAASESPIIIGD
jgi:hypothetical protein